jgi:hypothetical protein
MIGAEEDRRRWASATVNGNSEAHTEDFFSQTPENSGRRRRRKKEKDTSPSNKDPGTSGQMRSIDPNSFRLCDSPQYF